MPVFKILKVYRVFQEIFICFGASHLMAKTERD